MLREADSAAGSVERRNSNPKVFNMETIRERRSI